MDFHPIANMFPLMEGPEFDALVADIAEHGQQEPISLYEGMILDGRNRWRACERLGLVPETREWKGGDPEAYVVSLNFHRRHLTKEQRDEFMRSKRAQGWTLQKIADSVGVNVATAHRATQGMELLHLQKLRGADGKEYPAHYQPRQVTEPGPDEDELDEDEPELDGCHNCKYLQSDGNDFWCTSLERRAWFPDVIRCDMRNWKPEQEEPLPHVAYNSGNNEWYTPPEYIEAARQVMGGIDLDPASSEIANRTVGATTFYTVTDDGLAWDWFGRVWMNPPYASNLIGEFCDKLAMHVKLGHVTEACVLVNNATETGWFNVLLNVAACVCFIRGRVRFIDAQGNPSGAPLQGQAVLYFGPNVATFGRVFSAFGTVLYAR